MGLEAVMKTSLRLSERRIERGVCIIERSAHTTTPRADVECTLMRLEDLEATVVALEEKYDGQVTREDLALELEALQAQCQVHSDRLYEANAAALHWKSQYQDVLSQLVASNLEKERLDGELRKVKKAAVLAMNRQYVQLDTNGASQLLLRTTRHYENESKKRSYSSDEIL
ncbi:hypothetical protein PC111_g14435 [Phytophthora cactorum]|nr:hypothetical protein PC111_g14435 [Phytophthora cactorum]